LQIFEGGFCVLVLVFILRTQERASDWQTEAKLFKSALKIVPNNAKVYYNIARLSTDKNDTPLAFAYYKKAIDLYPEYEAALMNLGNLYREIQDYELAEQHLRRALSIVEDFPAAWMNLGIVQAGTRNYNDALVSYRRALGLRKNYPNCLYNIGNLYLELKNTSLAMKFWRDAIALNPKHQLAWANILALLDNQGKAEAVVETSEAALKYLPDEPSILFTRANALGKLNQFDESERLFRRIIDKRPDYPLYHANLGVLYHRWRKPEMAKQFYASALKLDPKMASARENLNKLSAKVLGAG
jgi:protein O-mannosyl-transferase